MVSWIIGGSLYLLAAGIYWAVYKLSYRLIKPEENEISVKVRKRLKWPGLILLMLFVTSINLYVIELYDWLLPVIKQSLTILYILTVAWILVIGIRLLKHFVLDRYDINTRDNLKARKIYTQFKIIERILIVLVVLLALAFSLMTFDGIKRIGVSIFASAGVAGLILGLAAQKVIGGVLAGFQIALTQPIRLGDAVIVENEWGWIEEINLTYVVIKIWDWRRIVVPTTYFIEKPFQNWTRNSANIMGTVFIHTDYSVPFQALRDAFEKTLEQSILWDRKVKVMQVTDALERSVEIRLLMSAVDSPTAWDLRVEIREKMLIFLQENYPHSLPHTRLLINEPTNENRGEAIPPPPPTGF